MITLQRPPLQLTTRLPLPLLSKCVFFVDADGVMRPWAEIVDAVLMIIIKFRKLQMKV